MIFFIRIGAQQPERHPAMPMDERVNSSLRRGWTFLSSSPLGSSILGFEFGFLFISLHVSFLIRRT